jgi:hypothetical protein
MSRHAYAQLGMTAAVSACLAAMIVVLGVFGARSLGVMTWHAPATGDARGAASLQLPEARIARPEAHAGALAITPPLASVARPRVEHAEHPPARAHRPRRAATHPPKRHRRASPKIRPATPAATPAPAIATATAQPDVRPPAPAPAPERDAHPHAPSRPHPPHAGKGPRHEAPAPPAEGDGRSIGSQPEAPGRSGEAHSPHAGGRQPVAPAPAPSIPAEEPHGHGNGHGRGAKQH